MPDETTPTNTDGSDPLNPAPPPAAQPPGWAPPPGAEAYPPAPPPALVPPAPAKPPSKWRVAIPLVIIGGFLAFVLWSVRDNQSADDLAVGTCFDVPTQTSVSTVTKHECTLAHDAEVFHNAEYDGDSETYPISLTMDRFVTDTCGPVFETYVGEAFEDSDLSIGYFYPSRDGWDDGDRTVTCYAQRDDEAKLTTTVKDSGG